MTEQASVGINVADQSGLAHETHQYRKLSRVPNGIISPIARLPKPGFLEFFAGSGLVAEGLRSSFSPLWANDISLKKANVYSANHAREQFQVGSIDNVEGRELPNAALSWASFPCQDLSLAGLIGGIDGDRSGLVWQWLRVLDEMQVRPPVLVAENVIGLVSADDGAHYRALHKAMVSRSYRVGTFVMNACEWLPQSRARVFVVAVDSRIALPAGVVDSGPNWLHTKAILNVVPTLEDWVWWKLPRPRERVVTLADIIDWQADTDPPKTVRHNISLIAPRHREILDGISQRGRYAFTGYKRTRNGRQVLELRFDGIAGCLRTPGGGSSRQLVVIKKNGVLTTRLLTIRETARLMGAPERYKIPGSYNDGYKAMGDAVAVPVARHLGRHLLLPLARAALHLS